MTENRTPSTRLNEIGKQLPYSVPEGFFEQFNEHICTTVATKTPRSKILRAVPTWHRIWHATASAAAIIALVIAFKGLVPDTVHAENLTIEQAFNNLSEEDQDTLLDTYRADVIFDY